MFDQKTLFECVPYSKYATSPLYRTQKTSFNHKATCENPRNLQKPPYKWKPNTTSSNARNFAYAQMKRRLCGGLSNYMSLTPSEAIDEQVCKEEGNQWQLEQQELESMVEPDSICYSDSDDGSSSQISSYIYSPGRVFNFKPNAI